MKLLRNSKILLMVLVPALTLGIGAGFSNFFFGNTTSAASSVDPSIENIRDNFHFDEIEDTNLFNTKFYDVTFYSQAVKDGDFYYKTSDSNSSYHKELGYFALTYDQFRNLQGQGAELYQISNNPPYNNVPEQVTDPDLVDIKIEVPETPETEAYVLYVVNHITFEKISTITPEIASALINPLCDLFDTHHSDPNPKDYLLKFSTWTFKSYTQIYYGLNRLNSEPRDTYTYATGYFPDAVQEIPNFNFLLSEQPGIENTSNDTTLGIFPIFSSGKDYSGQSSRKDAIIIKEAADGSDTAGNGTKTNLLSTDLNAFMPDSLSTTILSDIVTIDNSDCEAISAYRFPGLEVYEDNTLISISNDFQRKQGKDSWGGDPILVQTEDHYVDWHGFQNYEDYLYSNDSSNTNTSSFSLSKGRYNLYLFVKERWAANDDEKGKEKYNVWPVQYRYSNCVDPRLEITPFDFSSENEEQLIAYNLKTLGIEPFITVSFGSTALYTCSTGGFHVVEKVFPEGQDGFYRQTFDYRDYFLVVEKMYSPKLLGGINSWDYDEETSSRPLFLQSSEDQNAYETRNISLSNDVTHPYEIVDEATGKRYVLSLPGTCFSIGLSSSKTEVNLPVVTYGDDGKPATVDGEEFSEAKIDDQGAITDKGSGNLPIVVIRDRTTNKFRADYYFSKNSGSTSDGLRTLFEVIDSYSQDDKDLLESISITGDYSGNLSSALDGGITNITDLLESTNILVAPHAGQYNLYLQYEFENVGSEPVVDVYAYRIKDLTVQIFNPGDLNNDKTIDGRDLVYRADGFVLTQNGSYAAYQKGYGAQGDSSSGESGYWLWTIAEDNDSEPNLTVDYIWSATDFVSGDPLEAETEFSKGENSQGLSEIMNYLWNEEGKTLIDITSGEYVTPHVIAKRGFVVTKSTILLAIYRPENFADYGNLFTGYGESTSQEASL